MIRAWKKSDNAAIFALEEKCFSDPWSEKMLDDCFKANNFYGLVCEENGEIVGYCGSVFDFWEAEILLVAVDERYRRRGIAKSLLSEIIDIYDRTGKEAIYLEVRRSNISAQSLYYGLGFEKIAEREKYYQNTEDAFVLKKSLKGEV
ncbi:MAG: ribosomal protein S18-alanine N-acetyltransferase [Clostridia bacterium]|nr:ribosomal protein S18-alanine N-acetyltransferase [Clostridia bacterium]